MTRRKRPGEDMRHRNLPKVTERIRIARLMDLSEADRGALVYRPHFRFLTGKQGEKMKGRDE